MCFVIENGTAVEIPHEWEAVAGVTHEGDPVLVQRCRRCSGLRTTPAPIEEPSDSAYLEKHPHRREWIPPASKR